MLKKIILNAVQKYLQHNIFSWTDTGVIYLAGKIREAEVLIPGSGQGGTKWQVVWKWLLNEAGEELIDHKDEIANLVTGIIRQLNKNKLW